MSASKNWKLALAALLSASVAMSGSGFNKASAADFIVAGGGGGGGGGAGDSAAADPGIGGGGGASYYGDQTGNWGAGSGASGAADGGSTLPSAGGAGGASTAPNLSNGDALNNSGGLADAGRGSNGQNGSPAVGGAGGTGGSGGHATSNGAAFSSAAGNYVVQNFTGITSDLRVTGGIGGTAGDVDFATATGGTGGAGGDAALKITGTNVSLGSVFLTGGFGGGDGTVTSGNPGIGGAGGQAVIKLATDATMTYLAIAAGAQSGTAVAGSAVFDGSGQTLTLANTGASSQLDLLSSTSAASFTVKTLILGEAIDHTVTFAKIGTGQLTFKVTDKTIVKADAEFIEYGMADTFELGSKGLEVDATSGPIALKFTDTTNTDASASINALTIRGTGVTITNTALSQTLDMEGKTVTFDLANVQNGGTMLNVAGGGLQTDANSTIAIEGMNKGNIAAKITLSDLNTAGSAISTASQTGSSTIADSYGNSGTLSYTVDFDGGANNPLMLRAYKFNTAGNWTLDDALTVNSETGHDQSFVIGGTLTLRDNATNTPYNFGFTDTGANDNTVFDVNTLNIAAQQQITLSLDGLEADGAMGSSPTNYARIRDIELQNNADLLMDNVATGIWTGNLITNNNVTFGSTTGAAALEGRTITTNITGAFDSTKPLISNGGNTLTMDDTTSWKIVADKTGRELLEAAVADPAGYVATEAANVASDVNVTLSSGFYNGLGYIDNGTGQLMAFGPRLFNMNSVKSQNPLMATNAMTSMLAGGGLAVSRSAATFAPMGSIGGDCSGVQYGAFGYGSYDRYRAGNGAHLRSNDFHVVAGPGIRFCGGTSVTDVGVFFEGGWSEYNAYSSGSGERYSGEGDNRSLGGGLLLRHSTSMGLYGEASFRMGEAKNTYDGVKSDIDTRFTSRTGYYGAHAGLGYILRQGETGSLDISAKGFWTKLENDVAKTRSGERVTIDDVDSYRSQVAVQYSYNLGSASARVMAGWEYEFDGKASGSINTDKIRRLDTLKGHSGIAEVGVDFKVAERATLGMGVHGSIGKRKGWGGSVQLGVGF